MIAMPNPPMPVLWIEQHPFTVTWLLLVAYVLVLVSSGEWPQ